MKRTSIIGIAMAATSLLIGAPAIAAAAEVNLDNMIVLQTDTSQIVAPDDTLSPDDLIVMVDTDLTLGYDLTPRTIGIDDSALAAAAITGDPSSGSLEKMAMTDGARPDFQLSSGFVLSKVFLTKLPAGAFVDQTSPVTVT